MSHAMELIGERWALLLVRELLLGPKRFADLHRGLPGAAPNVAVQRLKELTAAGIVRRRTLPPPTAAQVYELTDWGQDLAPIVQQLSQWASRSPGMRLDAPLSADSLVLSLPTLYVPTTLLAEVVLRIGIDEFTVSVGVSCRVRRGAAPQPDVEFRGDVETLRELLVGGVGLDELVAGGRLAVLGDLAMARAFSTLFPLPETVPVPR